MDNTQQIFDQEISIWDKNIKKRLEKLESESFYKETKHIIIKYFNQQSRFNNINDFEKYLKKIFQDYTAYFRLTDYEEQKKQIKNIDFIDETYDQLIYYWEYNPVEARKQRIKEEKVSWEKSKIRWYFWKILRSE